MHPSRLLSAFRHRLTTRSTGTRCACPVSSGRYVTQLFAHAMPRIAAGRTVPFRLRRTSTVRLCSPASECSRRQSSPSMRRALCRAETPAKNRTRKYSCTTRRQKHCSYQSPLHNPSVNRTAACGRSGYFSVKPSPSRPTSAAAQGHPASTGT